MIVIPLQPSEPDQQFDLQIGANQYTFRALWNARARQWFLDIYELDGTPILRSIAIVLGAFLGRTSTHPLLRGGSFIAVDTTQSQTDAGLDDLGTRVELRYYPQDELVAQLAASGFVS